MAPTTKEGQRAELHKTIWHIANDLRGSVDGWDFKTYVLGVLFSRFVSENLTAYINKGEEFAGQDPLSERRAQDHRSWYLDFYAEFRKDRDGDKELINDDVVFEIELIKQVEINVDYILMLVEKCRASFGDGEDKEIRAEISRAVDASPSLRSKKDLVEDFVDSVSVTGAVDEQWQAFVAAKRESELESLITEQQLRPEQTRAFLDAAFRDGQLRTTGTAIANVLPPVSRFTADGGHGEKKRTAIAALTRFFERFFGLGASNGE